MLSMSEPLRHRHISFRLPHNVIVPQATQSAPAVLFFILCLFTVVAGDQYALLPQTEEGRGRSTEMRLRYDMPMGVELLGTGLALALVYTLNAAMASHIRYGARRGIAQAAAPPTASFRPDGTTTMELAPLSAEALATIKKLWQGVERRRHVQTARVTQVLDAPASVDVGSNAVRRAPGTSAPSWPTPVTVAHRTFPRDFIWGVANAAAQVEGAVKADNRGPSIWDSFSHNVKDGVLNGDTFDVATNFRYMYKVDIARVRAMGAQAFSFTVSWPRVMPLGSGEVNRDGLAFYKSVVAEILGDASSNVRPMMPIATLFHWDLPLQLEMRYGGMTSDRFIDDFVQYALVVFTALGKSGIKMWFTFNEPQVWCMQRYKLVAPHVHGKNDTDDKFSFQCAANLVKAHARVYQLFKHMQADGQIDEDAQISYKNAGAFNAPLRPGNPDDEAAVQRAVQMYLGLFAEPIHKTGNWPDLVLQKNDKDTLPRFIKEEIKMIKGSADFFGTDFYTGGLTKATERDGGFQACIKDSNHVAWPSCSDPVDMVAEGMASNVTSDPLVSTWLSNTAPTLRPHLQGISQRWPTRGGIYITEIGWAENGEQGKTSMVDIRNDTGRQQYFRDHLIESLLAVTKDDLPLKGILAWSLTSNVEWEVGLAPRFGLETVNYTDPMLPRTFLGSFFLIRDFFAKHGSQ